MKLKGLFNQFLIIAFILLLFTSCETIKNNKYNYEDLQNSNYYTNYSNIAYGSATNQKVDIYLPNKTSSKNINLIVLLHGGTWITNHKSDWTPFSHWIMKNIKNVAVANVEFRYVDDNIHFYDLIDDVNHAIQIAISKAKENNLNITGIAIGGNSSGGQISLMYAYNCADKSSVPIKFCFSLSSPSNLEDINFIKLFKTSNNFEKYYFTKIVINLTDTNNVGDAIAALPLYSPINFITPQSVPTIILHGSEDTIVPITNSIYLNKILTENGVYNDLIIIEGGKHHLRNTKVGDNFIKNELIKFVNLYFK